MNGDTMLARSGRYLLIGLWASRGELPFDPSYAVRNNLKLIGTQFAQPAHYHQAMMVASRYHREFPFSDVITHRFALDRASDALALVLSGMAAKIVMVPNASESFQLHC